MKPSFASAARDYYALFNSVVISKRWAGKASDKWTEEADLACARILRNRARYEGLAVRTTVPWYVIALIHFMEAGLDFRAHLANGDPLTARTVNVPAGLPAHTHPGPFTFEEGAVAALEYDRLDEVGPASAWDVARICYELEQFNGWGYRGRAVDTPYLWSGSQHYSAGKFVADGKWSRTAVSGQLGAAVLLHELCARHIVNLPAAPARAALRAA